MPDSRAIPDPRSFPDPAAAGPVAARLYALTDESLAATTGQSATAADAAIAAALGALLAAGDGPGLAATFAGAPSVAVYRHLWRQLARQIGPTPVARDGGMAVTVFAIPVIVVAAIDGGGRGATLTLPCVLDEPASLVSILREHRALGGNQNFGFANVLAGADAIDLARLPAVLAWRGVTDIAAAGVAPTHRELAPFPIAVAGGAESVHLRMLVGSAVAAPGVDLLRDATVGAWGTPFAQALARQLAVPGASVLALPRAPQSPLAAVHQGRAAQREVGAQIFASNAIRKIRASVGEPSAVISAHVAPDAPGGGELRLSLSSPFEPRDAEGFRCPLYPPDRVGDVATLLVELLRDCRVADIRVLAGIHADRVAGTGQRLLFKPETIPGGATAPRH
jgi:hypothetical protein